MKSEDSEEDLVDSEEDSEDQGSVEEEQEEDFRLSDFLHLLHRLEGQLFDLPSPLGCPTARGSTATLLQPVSTPSPLNTTHREG